MSQILCNHCLKCSLFPAQFVGADVSKRKDGGIRKSILVKGKGRETSNDGATCEGNNMLANVCHLDSLLCLTIVLFADFV